MNYPRLVNVTKSDYEQKWKLLLLQKILVQDLSYKIQDEKRKSKEIRGKIISLTDQYKKQDEHLRGMIK
jgi:hypothetical protein